MAEMRNTKSLVLVRNGEKDGFGERFGQEIPDGTLVFLEGEEGAGKSIFFQRFCYAFLTQGITCTYISTQYSVKSFLRQTASVGYDTRNFLMSGKLFFISTEVTLAETKPRDTFLDALISTKKIYDQNVVFIDSLSTLLNESLKRDNLMELTNFINRLRGSGKTIFVSANPHDWNDEIHKTFQMICDVHFRVARESMPGIGLVYNIYLNKFNGARHRYEPTTCFAVQPGSGLAIETSGVAF